MAFAGRDLTDIHTFTRDEIVYVLDKAVEMKKALRAKEIPKYRLAEGRDLLA